MKYLLNCATARKTPAGQGELLTSALNPDISKLEEV